MYQVHDQNRVGVFEVRVVKIFSTPQKKSRKDSFKSHKVVHTSIKCDLPMFDFDGKPIPTAVNDVVTHQLVKRSYRDANDTTFGSNLYTTRRAAERAAKQLNDYVARQDKYVHTIGVYPNGEFLEGIKTNSVDRNHIVGHVYYNLDWRPGRALIVNNRIVYDGNVDRDKLKRIIEHFKQNPPRLDRDSAPYQ